MEESDWLLQVSSSYTVGLVACAVAVVSYGCNLVPVKRVHTGDGMFFQWVECAAIWFLGLVVQLARGSPPVYPLAMIGGLLWCSGNVLVVPVIKTIGMGLGILLWGSTNLIMGWASGHFGLFGLEKDTITRPVLNYLGLFFALLRLVLFLFIKSDAGISRTPKVTMLQDQEDDDDDPLLAPSHLQRSLSESTMEDRSWVDHLSPVHKRFVGCIFALIAGTFYGLNFVPCLYIQQNYNGASQHGLDYVFSHFTGIFGASTVYFLIYSSYMQNRPQLPKGLIWPSIVAGIIWAIGQCAWFIATYSLTMSVAFPIITSGPCMIAAAWGVFYFKEIRGEKNYIVLTIGFFVVVAASVLSALSKL